MNYERQYQLLIEKYGFKEKPDNGYYERHHIIPKCIGGPDTKENQVYVRARVHYLAHWLLYKIYGGHGLAAAWLRTSHCSIDGKPRVTGKQYEIVKRKLAEEASIRYTGKGNPMYGKSWNKGKTGVQDYSHMTGIKNPNSKYTYEITEPNGNVVIVEAISEYCEPRGLCRSHLRNVALGKTKQHKGYTAKILEDRNELN
jgi:hypothetical protein